MLLCKLFSLIHREWALYWLSLLCLTAQILSASRLADGTTALQSDGIVCTCSTHVPPRSGVTYSAFVLFEIYSILHFLKRHIPPNRFRFVAKLPRVNMILRKQKKSQQFFMGWQRSQTPKVVKHWSATVKTRIKILPDPTFP